MANMADEDNPRFTSFPEGYGDDATAAVLTTTQRQYFLGEREIEGSGERALRRRIRKRIRAALWDLLLLSRTYPTKELEKVQTDDEGNIGPQHALAGFLYLLQPEDDVIIEDIDEEVDPSPRDRRAAWTEINTSRGIKRAIEYREDVDADVDVSIELERKESLDELAEGDLSQLSRDQLDTLLVADKITHEEYAAANELILNRRFG